MVSKTCQRCGQVASYDDPFHRGFGAKSRTDNKTVICSPCGVDEAMQDFMRGQPTPQCDWPIN